MKNKLPVFSASRLGPELGCLVSYTADLSSLYRDTAVYVGKILKGSRPSDLPVSLPTKFELVVNLEVAKIIGLEVPATLVAPRST
ncbi:hypothetical protein I6F09_19215 [Bradyrhizobium sp. IC3195]|nr:hypothetical protein [Bradyrhizobium sp. IC3195]